MTQRRKELIFFGLFFKTLFLNKKKFNPEVSGQIFIEVSISETIKKNC